MRVVGRHARDARARSEKGVRSIHALHRHQQMALCAALHGGLPSCAAGRSVSNLRGLLLLMFANFVAGRPLPTSPPDSAME